MKRLLLRKQSKNAEKMKLNIIPNTMWLCLFLNFFSFSFRSVVCGDRGSLCNWICCLVLL